MHSSSHYSNEAEYHMWAGGGRDAKIRLQWIIESNPEQEYNSHLDITIYTFKDGSKIKHQSFATYFLLTII